MKTVLLFATINLVLTQTPNSFVCIDDTNFKHFIDANNFVIQQCPPGLCFTRSPSTKNPCIGKFLAEQIDHKENNLPATITVTSSLSQNTCSCGI